MMKFLIQAFKWAGPALIGYFANDVGDGLSKVLPGNVQSQVKDKTGNFAWWFVALITLVLGVVASLIFSTLSKGKGKKFLGFALILFAGYCAVDLCFFIYSGGYISLLKTDFKFDDVSFGTALVTLTTGVGVVTLAPLQFVPERIAYVAATQLTGIKVIVQGDGVIFDSDAPGLSAIGVSRILGQVTNNYIITLANSLIKNKNVQFEFTNSAAQTPTIYFDSDSMASGQGNDIPLFLQMMKVPLLVGGNDFSDFATLSLPSLAAGDSVTIQYKDGTVQANMNRIDLQYRLGMLQNVVNTPVYSIDNYDQRIKAVTVNVAAAQTGYVQRFVPSISRGMVAGQM